MPRTALCAASMPICTIMYNNVHVPILLQLYLFILLLLIPIIIIRKNENNNDGYLGHKKIVLLLILWYIILSRRESFRNRSSKLRAAVLRADGRLHSFHRYRDGMPNMRLRCTAYRCGSRRVRRFRSARSAEQVTNTILNPISCRVRLVTPTIIVVWTCAMQS